MPSGTPQEGSAASTEQRFAEWLARFRESARAAGIDDATLDDALAGVRLHPRAIVGDRSQREFIRTLWD